MFGTIGRLFHLERTVTALRTEVKAKQDLILSLMDDKADILRRYDLAAKGYSALVREMAVPICDPVKEALRGIVAELGRAEWATPEHAEEILRELIDFHYHRGSAALAMAGEA